MLEQLPEHLPDMLDMFLHRFGVDQDVVEVGNAKVIEIFLQCAIDIQLERSRSIRQSKRHDKVFKMTIARPKRSLPFFTKSNSEKIVSCSEIDLCIPKRMLQAIEELRYQRQGIAVLYSGTIQYSIIDA